MLKGGKEDTTTKRTMFFLGSKLLEPFFCSFLFLKDQLAKSHTTLNLFLTFFFSQKNHFGKVHATL
jgi:hypothetical protein